MSRTAAPRFTPITTDLLRWWFGEEASCLRGGHGFHDRQRRLTEQTIAAHEAMDGESLRLQQPLHRLALTQEAQQIEVMLALLVWQLLNRNDARAAGIEDPRFTRHFILMAPHHPRRERLQQVFRGLNPTGGHGPRDFATSDLARLTPWLIPTARRQEVHAFVRANVCEGAPSRSQVERGGVIALTDGRVEALECLARLPHAMLFDDETRPPHLAHLQQDPHELGWRHHVRRFALSRRGFGVQVVFSEPPEFRLRLR
jgi:hypothetical protein